MVVDLVADIPSVVTPEWACLVAPEWACLVAQEWAWGAVATSHDFIFIGSFLFPGWWDWGWGWGYPYGYYGGYNYGGYGSGYGNGDSSRSRSRSTNDLGCRRTWRNVPTSSTRARVLRLHILLKLFCLFLFPLGNGSNLNTHTAEDFLLGVFHLPCISRHAVIETVQM